MYRDRDVSEPSHLVARTGDQREARSIRRTGRPTRRPVVRFKDTRQNRLPARRWAVRGDRSGQWPEPSAYSTLRSKLNHVFDGNIANCHGGDYYEQADDK